jgi:hypothetical protein
MQPLLTIILMVTLSVYEAMRDKLTLIIESINFRFIALVSHCYIASKIWDVCKKT